jgi:hypothetical protein
MSSRITEHHCKAQSIYKGKPEEKRRERREEKKKRNLLQKSGMDSNPSKLLPK